MHQLTLNITLPVCVLQLDTRAEHETSVIYAGLLSSVLSPCMLPHRCLCNVEECQPGEKKHKRPSLKKKKEEEKTTERGQEKKKKSEEGKSKALVKQNHMGECGAGFDLGPPPD